MAKQDLYEEEEFLGVLIIRLRGSSDICGMLLKTRYQDGRSCFTTYRPTPSGYQWITQSNDREKELASLRSLLYADCECCNEWPCNCTPDDLAAHAAWLVEIADNLRG